MSSKQIVGAYEFRSYGNDKAVDVQIDEWLQKYPQVTIVDIKYEVVPYVDGDALHFATFALVLFHEPDPDSSTELNRASTQRMEAPASAMRARRQ